MVNYRGSHKFGRLSKWQTAIIGRDFFHVGVFMQIQLTDLKRYALYPLRAMFSRRFYFDVMMKMRGVGFTYMLILCAVCAVPSSVKVMQAFANLQNYELTTVVAQIPPSYISPSGVLSPSNPDDAAPLVIKNSKGQPVLAYNLDEQTIEGYEGGRFPITITATRLLVNTTEGLVEFPWQTLYGNQGGTFEPLAAAQALDSFFNSSFMVIWGLVTCWLFSIQAFVVLVGACVSKALARFVGKITVSFRLALRLSAFGSTLVVALLTLQFYVSFGLTYLLMCMIPVIYTLSFLGLLHRVLDASLKDVNYALNSSNPFYPWFEVKSRLRADGSVDSGPDYSQLTPEQQQERAENLKRAILNEYPHLRYMLHSSEEAPRADGFGYQQYQQPQQPQQPQQTQQQQQQQQQQPQDPFSAQQQSQPQQQPQLGAQPRHGPYDFNDDNRNDDAPILNERGYGQADDGSEVQRNPNDEKKGTGGTFVP